MVGGPGKLRQRGSGSATAVAQNQVEGGVELGHVLRWELSGFLWKRLEVFDGGRGEWLGELEAPVAMVAQRRDFHAREEMGGFL